MKALLWITISLFIYSAPMTVEYTEDGITYLIDDEGYEWEYEGEIYTPRVNVLLSNEHTPDLSDDTIIAVEEVNEL